MGFGSILAKLGRGFGRGLGAFFSIFSSIGIKNLLKWGSLILFISSLWPFFVQSWTQKSLLPVIQEIGARLAFFFTELGSGLQTLAGNAIITEKLAVLWGITIAMVTLFWFFYAPIKLRRATNPNADIFWPFAFLAVIYVMSVVLVAGIDPVNTLWQGGKDFFTNPPDVPYYGDKFQNASTLTNNTELIKNVTNTSGNKSI